jgi:glyoxylase-like metal-dependent hydrolase (beta-lactamase superfamily II)
MKVQKVGKRSLVFTYQFPEWNLNLHIINGDRYNYVIDTGLGPKCVQPLMKHLKGKPIVVINTHYHWDHMWGNCAFPDSIIISHPLCREFAREKWDEMTAKYRQYIAGNVEMRLPDVTFEGSLYFADDGIRIMHTPGHTPDSISVLDEADGVLDAGDNIGDTPRDIVPNIDCPKDVYIKTLEDYRKMEFEACVSGHNIVQGSDIAERILAVLRKD